MNTPIETQILTLPTEIQEIIAKKHRQLFIKNQMNIIRDITNSTHITSRAIIENISKLKFPYTLAVRNSSHFKYAIAAFTQNGRTTVKNSIYNMPTGLRIQAHKIDTQQPIITAHSGYLKVPSFKKTGEWIIRTCK